MSDQQLSAGDFGGLSRSHSLDHAADVVVADRLAVLAHRDDGVVDLRELVGGEREAKLLGALADGVTASGGRAPAG